MGCGLDDVPIDLMQRLTLLLICQTRQVSRQSKIFLPGPLFIKTKDPGQPTVRPTPLSSGALTVDATPPPRPRPFALVNLPRSCIRSDTLYAWEKNNIRTGKKKAPDAVTYPTKVNF